MDEMQFEQKIADAVYNKLVNSLGNNDNELPDDKFLEKVLFIQRRNAAFNLLIARANLSAAVQKQKDFLNSDVKDTVRLEQLTADVASSGQRVRDNEYRLQSIIKATEDSEIKGIITEFYGTVDVAQGIEKKGDA